MKEPKAIRKYCRDYLSCGDEILGFCRGHVGSLIGQFFEVLGYFASDETSERDHEGFKNRGGFLVVTSGEVAFYNSDFLRRTLMFVDTDQISSVRSDSHLWVHQIIISFSPGTMTRWGFPSGCFPESRQDFSTFNRNKRDRMISLISDNLVKPLPRDISGKVDKSALRVGTKYSVEKSGGMSEVYRWDGKSFVRAKR